MAAQTPRCNRWMGLVMLYDGDAVNGNEICSSNFVRHWNIKHFSNYLRWCGFYLPEKVQRNDSVCRGNFQSTAVTTHRHSWSQVFCRHCPHTHTHKTMRRNICRNFNMIKGSNPQIQEFPVVIFWDEDLTVFTMTTTTTMVMVFFKVVLSRNG